jgi:AcrR family transcriptional regulator
MPTTTRGLRRADKREAIARAAETLFRVHGFEHTTVDQIAAGAGVSRRTFFRYFATKDAVVFPHAEERLEQFLELLALDPDEPALDMARRSLRAMAGHFAVHRDELLLQHRLIESSPLLIARERNLDRRWEEALAAALLTRLAPATERRAAALAGAVLGALRALLHSWYGGGGREDLQALVDDALDLLAPAFRTVGDPTC